ncbi:uncharacterized protein [Dermacentor albipictus]|uniref:uncharacterized protein isoform X2 n=1 Tax=Dermacentor albipictus TaxID=60249 RepID=UPI0038FC0805
MVCAQDGGHLDGGSYDGFDGGEGGDFVGGFGGGDDGFVGDEGGYGDGAYDGTAMQPVYVASETIAAPAVVLYRKRRSPAHGRPGTVVHASGESWLRSPVQSPPWRSLARPFTAESGGLATAS